MPSFILICPTVWPQCTNVTDRTDRQTGQERQRTDSTGRTLLQTVAQKTKVIKVKNVVSQCRRLQDGRVVYVADVLVVIQYNVLVVTSGYRRSVVL